MAATETDDQEQPTVRLVVHCRRFLINSVCCS